MDPTATLDLIREIAEKIKLGGDHQVMAEFATELEAAVTDLDEWLSRGGFLPQQWAKEKMQP